MSKIRIQKDNYNIQAETHYPQVIPTLRSRYRRQRFWYMPGHLRGTVSVCVITASGVLTCISLVSILPGILREIFVVVGFVTAIAVIPFAVVHYEGNERFWDVTITLAIAFLFVAFWYWVTYWSHVWVNLESLPGESPLVQ
ncbi:MAG: hypothetical protein F6K55_03100 [Moorea sp. SIO4A3]|nr:hypothetical protein [Moorena sp. SIO4A3]